MGCTQNEQGSFVIMIHGCNSYVKLESRGSCSIKPNVHYSGIHYAAAFRCVYLDSLQAFHRHFTIPIFYFKYCTLSIYAITNTIGCMPAFHQMQQIMQQRKCGGCSMQQDLPARTTVLSFSADYICCILLVN